MGEGNGGEIGLRAWCGGHGVVVRLRFLWWGEGMALVCEPLEGDWKATGRGLGGDVLLAGGVCAIVCRSTGREARAARACRRIRGVAQPG